MKIMPISVSYTVSAMEMVGLLLWTTGNLAHMAEFRIAKYLKPCTEF
jgi:hypothetical protein